MLWCSYSLLVWPEVSNIFWRSSWIDLVSIIHVRLAWPSVYTLSYPHIKTVTFLAAYYPGSEGKLSHPLQLQIQNSPLQSALEQLCQDWRFGLAHLARPAPEFSALSERECNECHCGVGNNKELCPRPHLPGPRTELGQDNVQGWEIQNR